MSGIRAALYLWSIYVGIGVVLTAPVVFLTRRRVEWQWWDLAGFILPFWVWMWLMTNSSRPKSLANLGEIGNLLIALAAVAVARALLGRRRGAVVAGVVGQVILVILAGMTYLLTPMLPE